MTCLDNMKISIVIPSYNENDNIVRLLDSISLSITHSDLLTHEAEIIVVDGGSIDGTLDSLKNFDVTTIHAGRSTISEARNLGGNASKGEYILFIDADMEVPKNWVSVVLGHFEEGSIDGFGFVEDIPDHTPWYAKVWSERLIAKRDKVMQVDFLPGRNICIKRSFFNKVQGFDAKLTTGEDKDFTVRLVANGAILYSFPRVGVVHHGFEKTWKEFIGKEYWRQSSHVDLIKKNGLSARLIRFPAISILHCLIAVIITFFCLLELAYIFSPSFFWSFSNVTVALTVLWLLPSVVLTLSKVDNLKHPVRAVQLIFLYWLRFHIAGVSVLVSMKST